MESPLRSKIDNQQANCMPSMEEVMHYEIHGLPKPIRFRRTAREYTRSFFECWQAPVPFNSFYCKEPDMNEDSGVVKRKCPLEAGDEHTVASSSSHECLTRPCACPDPGKSKEMCVIKKVENWLLGKCLDQPEPEEMDTSNVPEVLSTPKWPPNVNKGPELEQRALASLPPSVLIRQIHGSLFPVYAINVRVVGVDPDLTDIHNFVRGHCPHYTCGTTVTNVIWENSGPLTYGKLSRPYCPECCQTRRKRYLNLFFHLELVVEDNLGQVTKIIVSRDMAVRFFGCTVYRFLLSNRRRLKIKKGLTALLEACNAPRSAPVPGITYDIRIMPIATQQYEQVKFHMFGDNLPLFQIVKKLPKT